VGDDPSATRRLLSIRVLGGGAAVGLAVVLAVMVASSLTWTAWRDTRAGVSGRYPASWSRQVFDDDLGLATHTGVVFSNVPHHFEYPDLPEGSSTSAWDYEGLPDDAVVVEVSETVRFSFACKNTTPFPLSLSDGHLAQDKPAYGAPPRLFISACIQGRNALDVHVLVFPDASARDRAAARDLVESIRPL
jgi:hypothetical protein